MRLKHKSLNLLTTRAFCHKCIFLDILGIFGVDIGQSTPNLLKKAFPTWQHASLSTHTVVLQPFLLGHAQKSKFWGVFGWGNDLRLKVPTKWNFRPLFHSELLKSMILWFVIFELGLWTSAYEFFLELQSWPIRLEMCDIPRVVKICKLVRLTS